MSRDVQKGRQAQWVDWITVRSHIHDSRIFVYTYVALTKYLEALAYPPGIKSLQRRRSRYLGGDRGKNLGWPPAPNPTRVGARSRYTVLVLCVRSCSQTYLYTLNCLSAARNQPHKTHHVVLTTCSEHAAMQAAGDQVPHYAGWHGTHVWRATCCCCHERWWYWNDRRSWIQSQAAASSMTTKAISG